MSKIIKILAFLLITFSLNFSTFVPQVLAADPCAAQSVNIKYSPDSFLENVGDLTIHFTILSQNTLTNLNGKEVRLHFPGFAGLGFGEYNTDSVTITSNTFDLVIKGDKTKRNNRYEPVLDWKPDPAKNAFEEYCSKIYYAVGASQGGCKIDHSLPKEAPPNSKFPLVKFLGLTNTDYRISYAGGGAISTTRTDNNGQGAFKDVPITGKIGDTIRLIISSNAPGAQSCPADITIRSAAPEPPTPDPNTPIMPGSPVTSLLGGPPPPPCKTAEDAKNDPNFDPKKDSICTESGGRTCDSTGNPAIQTAIGCIHTKPEEFVKDFLKFFVGISGGFAFLMMLLGAFQMVTSGGNPETLKTGQQRFTSAIIGLLFVILSVIILRLLGVDILGILPE